MRRRLGSWLALLAALAAARGAAGAERRPAPAGASWEQVFATVGDTVYFLGADGALWRGPFALAARETLWAPHDQEHIVRLRVSPDGRRVALLTRRAEEDTTWIWSGGPEPPRRRGLFASLVPYRWSQLHFEPILPTIADRGVRGARLLRVGAQKWGRSCNTLDWIGDGRGFVFGYNDGIGFAAADTGSALQVSPALPMDVMVLDPSPLVLVNAIVLRSGVRQGAIHSTPQEVPPQGMTSMNESLLNPTLQGVAWYLLYPGYDRWRAFPAGSLTSDRAWTASESSVWWVAGKPPGRARAGSAWCASTTRTRRRWWTRRRT